MQKKTWAPVVGTLGAITLCTAVLLLLGQQAASGWQAVGSAPAVVESDTAVQQVQKEYTAYPWQQITVADYFKLTGTPAPAPEDPEASSLQKDGTLAPAEVAAKVGALAQQLYGADFSALTQQLVLLNTGGYGPVWVSCYVNDPALVAQPLAGPRFLQYEFQLDATTGAVLSVRRTDTGETYNEAPARTEMDAPLTPVEEDSLQQRALAAAQILGLQSPQKYAGEADFSMRRGMIDQAVLQLKDGSVYLMKFDYQYENGGLLCDCWKISGLEHGDVTELPALTDLP